MQTHYSCRLVALIASCAIAMPAVAQEAPTEPARSMQFQMTDAQGNELFLLLRDADFSEQKDEALLEFVGHHRGIEGATFEVNLTVSVLVIKGIMHNCITAIDMGDAMLGVSKDAHWIGVSEHGVRGAAKAVTIHTQAVTTSETSTLRMAGDYADLLKHFGKVKNPSEAELLLAQGLAVFTSVAAKSCMAARP